MRGLMTRPRHNYLEYSFANFFFLHRVYFLESSMKVQVQLFLISWRFERAWFKKKIISLT